MYQSCEQVIEPFHAAIAQVKSHGVDYLVRNFSNDFANFTTAFMPDDIAVSIHSFKQFFAWPT